MSKIKNIPTWVSIPEQSDFSVQNLPFGIFSVGKSSPRVGIAIGNQIIDLAAVAAYGLFVNLNFNVAVFEKSTLNDFIATGKTNWSSLRNRIQELLNEDNYELKSIAKEVLVPMEKATMHLPVSIGDYTDFYSSREHATNVGKLFRDPENALMPNWEHMPVAYHGRSSSIVVSGTDIRRPSGQTKTSAATAPSFGPTTSLDFELEMAFIIGKSTNLGDQVSTDQAEDHIFGMVLFNDWSARDIQKWEYVPLGPFLGKSFASSMSPWIVTLEALQPFKTDAVKKDTEILPYLKCVQDFNIDINLEAYIQPKNGEEELISTTNYKYLYWNYCQQLAHHTINGCNVNIGDLLASGTISGPDENSFGSLLEITAGGKKSLSLNNNVERKFLEDGDSITLCGFAQKDNVRVGFGEVTAKILPQ
ncbi:MAG: fumarylacetoacetase [Flavobacteriales bacterium]|nr:fumarylacetoacetase [Flavobacteriales bacterium]